MKKKNTTTTSTQTSPQCLHLIAALLTEVWKQECLMLDLFIFHLHITVLLGFFSEILAL